MRSVLPRALLSAVILVGACSGPPPSGTAAYPTDAPATPSSVPTVLASPTPIPPVRAPAGVATAATVRGAIYLGFEACVGLTPNASSAYLPPFGQDDFVLFFPKGWKVVAAHPSSPLFGDQFTILDHDGTVVARDGDTIEVAGEIRAIEATYCGFGWPVTVGEVRSLASASPAPS